MRSSHRLSALPLSGAALLVLMLLSFVPAAHAGVMRHWACQTRTAATGTQEGWSGFPQAAGGRLDFNCANRSGAPGVILDLRDVASSKFGEGVQAYYRAPANTSIGNAYISMVGSLRETNSPNQYGAVFYRDAVIFDAEHVLEQCQYFSGCRQLQPTERVHAVNGHTWYATLTCGGDIPDSQCGGGDPAYLQILSSAFDLIDNSAPVVGGTTGTATQSNLTGTESLMFPVSDVGVGVADVEVRIGSTAVVPRRVINANGGRCVPTEGGYAWQVPCPLSTSVSLNVDTTKVPNGTQMLTARVWDAAGNETTAVSLRVNVANGGAVSTPTPKVTPTPTPTPAPTPTPTVTPTPSATPQIVPEAPPGGGTITSPPAVGGANGTGGSPASAKLVPSRTSPSVAAKIDATVKITGVLRDAAKKPIAGARIDVFETVAPSRGKVKVGSIVTDAKGAYEYQPATSASRKVELAYSAEVGGSTYRSTTTVKVNVSHPVSFRVSPGTASRGELVRFTGKVSGPLPSGGMLIELSALTKSSRIQFKNLRTRKDGTFSYTRRFRTTGRFSFQVKTLTASDPSLSPGQSGIAKLRIR